MRRQVADASPNQAFRDCARNLRTGRELGASGRASAAIGVVFLARLATIFSYDLKAENRSKVRKREKSLSHKGE